MPIRPRSEVSFVKTTLSCPLYAADFDPYNRGYLVVGGGGGESKSGVPNQISVLDISNRAEISTAVEVELSREEDNVQSLATLSTKDGLIVFAGINSGVREQNEGKNEHFRALGVKVPPRKKLKTDDANEKGEMGEWKLLGKRALLRPSTVAKKETYQRLLRLSPAQRREGGSNRVGAVASGMAKDSEIVVFNATKPIPEDSDILAKIDLPENEEAVDLDLAEPEEGDFSLVYCTDFDLHEQTFNYDFQSKKVEKTPRGPRRIHQLPLPNVSEGAKSRPKFRCLRFLNSQNVVALVNKPHRSGAELRVYHLYPTGPAIMVKSQALPSRIKQAVSMDVCTLDSDKEGNQQMVVAIAGQDVSIEVYTVNYVRRTDTFSSFRSYLTLRDVHEHQMTKICFSPFHRPAAAGGQDEKATGATKQYIRLASVSMGNTVVVDTFPVSPLKEKDQESRYLLSSPTDETWAMWSYVVLIALIGVAAAYVVQGLMKGFQHGGLSGANRTVMSKATNIHSSFSSISSTASEIIPTNIAEGQERIHSLLSSHGIEHPSFASTESDLPQSTAIVLRPNADSDGIALDVHPDEVPEHAEAKHWHELEEHQKVTWRERLKQAGHWAEEEGETVFKGILFSEYAGAIGQAAADVLREL